MTSNIYNNMRTPKDNCYTKYEDVKDLIIHLEKENILNDETVVWLPFDTDKSNFYKVLNEKGYQVVNSHISQGLDFYEYAPENFDIIITNPPFSRRTKLLTRLKTLNKPFVILQGAQFFNNFQAIKFLSENEPEISFILPGKRLNFEVEKEPGGLESKNNIAFYSFWLCYKTRQEGIFNML